MKKIIFFLIVIGLNLCLVSCKTTTTTTRTTQDDTEQTVFVYMPWSTNLTSYFYTNISDWEKTINNNGQLFINNRIVVFISTSPTEATLFELQSNNGKATRKTIKNYENPAITTSEGITSILNDVKSYANAERYSMIVGSHGMGWLPVSSSKARSMVRQKMHWDYEDVPLTRYFGGLTAEYQTEVTTLADAILNAGMEMEYILFDDCYMSSIEVAYDLKNVTNYLVACPTEIMAYGFPYAEIGKYLVGQVDYESLCEGFYSFYKNFVVPCGTIGVIDCTELDNLATIMMDINQRYSFDNSKINTIQRMDGYSPVIFFDYGDYVEKLCLDNDLLRRFKEQLERTVPYKAHTDNYYSMSRGRVPINAYSGVTISDPSLNTLTRTKETTTWYKATHTVK